MREFTIITSCGRIQGYSAGTGKTNLILLHGAGCDSAMLTWRAVMERCGEDFTVYSFDFPGYGKSDRTADLTGKKFYKKLVSCVKQFADSLGLDSFVLAGLSMGGAVAIRFALKYPERVTMLVPVDSWGLTETLPAHQLCHLYMQKTDFTMGQFRTLARSKRLTKWAITYALIGNRDLVTDELVDEVQQACREDGAGTAMLSFQRSSTTLTRCVPYFGKKLKKLTMPVVLVTGSDDPLVPVKDVILALKYIPNGKCHVIKGCRHWSVRECPTNFVRIVRENLQN